GAYLGFMLGGGVYLWLISQVGFQWATIALAATVLVLALPFAALAADRMASHRETTHRPSLRFAVARREVRLGLFLIFACGVGPRIAAGLLGPFMVDKGIDLAVLGILNGIVSVGAGLVGTLLGGALVHVLGAPRAVGAAV